MRRLRQSVAVLLALVVAAAVGGPVAMRLREPAELGALPSDVPGRLIAVHGHRVHVVERGEGSPLVLIHGFGGSTHDFEEHVLDPLAKTHHVIAVDLFGYGWSERRDDFVYGLPLWSEQIAGTLDALGIERAAVVGHSMGGAVATVFASRHPDRIDHLILLDAFYPPTADEITPVFRALRMPILGEVALGAVADGSAPGFSAAQHVRALAWFRLRGTRRGMLRYVRDPAKLAQLTAAYPTIATPTLVFHGTADPFVRYAAMQRAAPAIRTARIVTVDGGGHFPFRDDPERVVKEVETFLAPTS